MNLVAKPKFLCVQKFYISLCLVLRWNCQPKRHPQIFPVWTETERSLPVFAPEWRSFLVLTMTDHRPSNQTPRTMLFHSEISYVRLLFIVCPIRHREPCFSTLKFHRWRRLLAVTLNWKIIFITLISGISLSTYIKTVYWSLVTIRFSVCTKIYPWFTNHNPQNTDHVHGSLSKVP